MKIEFKKAQTRSANRKRAWWLLRPFDLLRLGVFIMNYKHGLCKHPIYRMWSGMKSRCYSKSYPGYHKYGGRGIGVCNEWLNNPQAYYDYVMSLENATNPGLTIDRIRNNEGYKPNNLRWATKHIQATNKRLSISNTTGFKGIWYDKKRDKWVPTLRIMGKAIWLGRYNLLPEALNKRNQYIIENNLTEYKLQSI